MDEINSVIYSAPVVEFVAVAKEFCLFLTQSEELSQKEFIDKLQKFIPLLYLKGSMLPYVRILLPRRSITLSMHK